MKYVAASEIKSIQRVSHSGYDRLQRSFHDRIASAVTVEVSEVSEGNPLNHVAGIGRRTRSAFSEEGNCRNPENTVAVYDNGESFVVVGRRDGTPVAVEVAYDSHFA